MNDRPRFTLLGKAISFLLVIGLVALGAFMLMRGGMSGGPADSTEGGDAAEPTVSEVKVEVPKLSPPAPFNYKDNIVPIEISEYAGYGGLIVANGGMEPNPDSFFAKEYGFKVKISMSESETRSPLNNGRLAATATTTDATRVSFRAATACGCETASQKLCSLPHDCQTTAASGRRTIRLR